MLFKEFHVRFDTESGFRNYLYILTDIY